MLDRLNKEQYLAAMGEKMINITETAELSEDIWNCAEELIRTASASAESVWKRRLEAVYENDTHTFRHILLFGEEKNQYVVIVVDLTDNSILGYYPLDLNEEYGTNGE